MICEASCKAVTYRKPIVEDSLGGGVGCSKPAFDANRSELDMRPVPSNC